MSDCIHHSFDLPQRFIIKMMIIIKKLFINLFLTFISIFFYLLSYFIFPGDERPQPVRSRGRPGRRLQDPPRRAREVLLRAVPDVRLRALYIPGPRRPRHTLLQGRRRHVPEPDSRHAGHLSGYERTDATAIQRRSTVRHGLQRGRDGDPGRRDRLNRPAAASRARADGQTAVRVRGTRAGVRGRSSIDARGDVEETGQSVLFDRRAARGRKDGGIPSDAERDSRETGGCSGGGGTNVGGPDAGRVKQDCQVRDVA